MSQINQYCKSYRTSFKIPRKNKTSYLDICDILVDNKTLKMRKYDLNKYLIAEILTQKSKNLETMSAELSSLINIFEHVCWKPFLEVVEELSQDRKQSED